MVQETLRELRMQEAEEAGDHGEQRGQVRHGHVGLLMTRNSGSRKGEYVKWRYVYRARRAHMTWTD